jgi:hypothetical protein
MILQKLFRIQMAIGSYQFKDCVFLSFQLKTDLDQWKNLLAETQSSKARVHCPCKGLPPTSACADARMHAQATSRKDDRAKVQCGIYSWLRDFSQVTLSKTLFYFGNIYSQQRMPNGRPMDVRGLSATSRPDFYAVYVLHNNKSVRTRCVGSCVHAC